MIPNPASAQNKLICSVEEAVRQLQNKYPLPDELLQLIRDMAREIFEHNPENVAEHLSIYLEERLKTRELDRVKLFDANENQRTDDCEDGLRQLQKEHQIPDGFIQLTRELARQICEYNPKNIETHLANYLDARMEIRALQAKGECLIEQDTEFCVDIFGKYIPPAGHDKYMKNLQNKSQNAAASGSELDADRRAREGLGDGKYGQDHIQSESDGNQDQELKRSSSAYNDPTDPLFKAWQVESEDESLKSRHGSHPFDDPNDPLYKSTNKDGENDKCRHPTKSGSGEDDLNYVRNGSRPGEGEDDDDDDNLPLCSDYYNPNHPLYKTWHPDTDGENVDNQLRNGKSSLQDLRNGSSREECEEDDDDDMDLPLCSDYYNPNHPMYKIWHPDADGENDDNQFRNRESRPVSSSGYNDPRYRFQDSNAENKEFANGKLGSGYGYDSGSGYDPNDTRYNSKVSNGEKDKFGEQIRPRSAFEDPGHPLYNSSDQNGENQEVVSNKSGSGGGPVYGLLNETNDEFLNTNGTNGEFQSKKSDSGNREPNGQPFKSNGKNGDDDPDKSNKLGENDSGKKQSDSSDLVEPLNKTRFLKSRSKSAMEMSAEVREARAAADVRNRQSGQDSHGGQNRTGFFGFFGDKKNIYMLFGVSAAAVTVGLIYFLARTFGGRRGIGENDIPTSADGNGSLLDGRDLGTAKCKAIFSSAHVVIHESKPPKPET